MIRKNMTPLSQKGFTILELMVATVVLSVVLLIATMTILGVGKLYYKGQNATHTNDTARNILEDVSQHIEFSSQPPNIVASPAITTPTNCPIFPAGSSTSLWCSNSIYAFCIDTTRYSFVIGQQFKDGSNHALWEDTIPAASVTNCKPLNVLALGPGAVPKNNLGGAAGTDGKELLLSGMRLTGFEIAQNPSTGAYDIAVDVAYGADDLLEPVSTTPPPTPNPHPTIDRMKCKSTIGDQFCATTDLSTSVMRRLE